MKYMLLIHAGEAGTRFDELDEEERAEITREFAELTRVPGVLGAHALHPADTATTVRVEDGRTLTTDGPFIEAKEAVGGAWVYEADPRSRWRRGSPSRACGGAVEVRPIVER